MSHARDLLLALWHDYQRLTPQAGKIHRLLETRGETVVNDHIALRTFADQRINIDRLARPFLADGYRQAGQYHFAEKKLNARHYEHDKLPKIFISELRLDECTPRAQSIIANFLNRVPDAGWQRADLPVAGRPWHLTAADYDFLANESEYAGWLAAFGFHANHFTVLVNSLDTVGTLQELNALLKQNGFPLNTAGGEIKGSPDDLLEQSSTLADKIEIDFTDAKRVLPSCYYEFARRYPVPGTGKLFQGFVPQSANKIFESTDRR